MKYIGYHRTSTREQHLDRGEYEIKKYCTDNDLLLFKGKVYTDQTTGKNFDRPSYMLIKELLEPGDALIVTEVDRLGRNKRDMLKELHYYKDSDIRVMVLEIPTTLVDYSKMDNSLANMMMETINNLLIEIYATFAQAELEKREKRQREGIDAKRRRNEWDNYGRPRVLSREKFAKEYQPVIKRVKKPSELIRELGLTQTTYYRYVKEYKAYIEDIIKRNS